MGSGITVKVRDRDRGYAKMVRQVGSAGDHIVRVGIMGQDAAESHQGGPLSNVAIGSIHEFGAGSVPQRSFLRATVDQHQDEIFSLLRKLGVGVVKGVTTEKRGLGITGEFVVGKIQERISAGIAPPNTDATKKRKGSSTPLVDTGQLRQSIRAEVVAR